MGKKKPRCFSFSVLPFKTRRFYFVLFFCFRSSSNLVLSLRLAEVYCPSVLQRYLKHPGPTVCHLCNLLNGSDTSFWEKRSYEHAGKGLCAHGILLSLLTLFYWCPIVCLSTWGRLTGLWLLHMLPLQPAIVLPVIHLFADPSPIIHSHVQVTRTPRSWSPWEAVEHRGSEHRLCSEAAIGMFLASAFRLVPLFCAPVVPWLRPCNNISQTALEESVFLSVSSTNPGFFELQVIKST